MSPLGLIGRSRRRRRDRSVRRHSAIRRLVAPEVLEDRTMLTGIGVFNPVVASTFVDAQISTGVATDSEGTVFIAHDTLQGQRIQSFDPNTFLPKQQAVTISGTLPGRLFAVTADMATHLPTNILPGGVQEDDLLNLLPGGQIGI